MSFTSSCIEHAHKLSTKNGGLSIRQIAFLIANANHLGDYSLSDILRKYPGILGRDRPQLSLTTHHPLSHIQVSWDTWDRPELSLTTHFSLSDIPGYLGTSPVVAHYSLLTVRYTKYLGILGIAPSCPSLLITHCQIY